jgi:hypothetical protein
MTTTAKIGIEMLAEGQSGAEITVNEGLVLLDAMVQCTVLEVDLNAPPGSPTNGDVYFLYGGSASGAWSGHDNEFAVYFDGWRFIAPGEGWLLFNEEDGKLYKWTAGDGLTALSKDVDANLTDSTTGTPGGTISNVGGSFNQTTLNNNLASIVASINNLKSKLRDAGIIN